MKKLLLTLLLTTLTVSIPTCSYAVEQLCWSYATEREDSVKLPQSEISEHRIYVNNDTAIVLPMVANCIEYDSLNLKAGDNNITVTTVDTGGRESAKSVTVVRNIAGTTPIEPPVTPINLVITGRKTGRVTEDFDSNNDGLLGSVGTLTAKYSDGTTETFKAETITTPYATLAITQDGEWTYLADRFSATINALNNGETLSDEIIVSLDSGDTATITIVIFGVTDELVPPNPPSEFK